MGNFMQLNSIYSRFTAVKQRSLEVFLGIALLTICSQIIIPIKPIFISMQTIAVMFIGLTYDKISGPLTISSYVTLGAFGVPLFGEFSSGFSVLSGTTGGYLIGFVPAVCVMTSLKNKIFIHNKLLNQISLCLIGNIIIIGLGYLWLSTIIGFSASFQGGVLPFIIPGMVKSLILIGLTNIVYSNNFKNWHEK
jgi:biotin transport system substrate-specific component